MPNRAIIFLETRRPIPATLSHSLRAHAIEFISTESKAEVVQFALRDVDQSLVFIHVESLDDDALAMVAAIHRVNAACPIVLLAASFSTSAVLGAFRAGATDILQFCATSEEVRAAIHSSLRRNRPARPVTEFPSSASHLSRMIGSGPSMCVVKEQILRSAVSNANVLITGESGTGKEVAAQLIHQNSNCRDRRFVALNCAAIPEALFESELFGHERGAFTGANVAREGKLQHAAGGTLFLDEIGDMPLASQAKILRAIENRAVQRLGSNVEDHIKVRLIAATNQNLELLTRQKKFRQDLYFRLNVVHISLPPLRERREDIPALTGHLIDDLCAREGVPCRSLASDLVERLQQHDWPGNVRELKNIIESILVFSSSRTIGVRDVPLNILERLHTKLPQYHDERRSILFALNSSRWNREQAAKALDCSRMTLYRKMVKYSISAQSE